MRHMHAPPSDCVYACVPGPKVGSKVGFPTLFPLLIFWGIGAYICGDVFPGNGEHCQRAADVPTADHAQSERSERRGALWGSSVVVENVVCGGRAAGAPRERHGSAAGALQEIAP